MSRLKALALAARADARSVHDNGDCFNEAVQDAYVTACNPTAILSLIERGERLQEALRTLVGAIESEQDFGLPEELPDEVDARMDDARSILAAIEEESP